MPKYRHISLYVSLDRAPNIFKRALLRANCKECLIAQLIIVYYDHYVFQRPIAAEWSRCDERPAHHSRHRHHIRVLQLIYTFKVALKTLYLFDSSWLKLNCCRDSVTLVNRMVDARPCVTTCYGALEIVGLLLLLLLLLLSPASYHPPVPRRVHWPPTVCSQSTTRRLFRGCLRIVSRTHQARGANRHTAAHASQIAHGSSMCEHRSARARGYCERITQRPVCDISPDTDGGEPATTLGGGSEIPVIISDYPILSGFFFFGTDSADCAYRYFWA